MSIKGINACTECNFWILLKIYKLEKVKKEKYIPKEHYSLVIMDNFKGQDNYILKELCDENFGEFVIVPYSLTDKFKPLDISLKKPA